MSVDRRILKCFEVVFVCTVWFELNPIPVDFLRKLSVFAHVPSCEWRSVFINLNLPFSIKDFSFPSAPIIKHLFVSINTQLFIVLFRAVLYEFFIELESLEVCLTTQLFDCILMIDATLCSHHFALLFEDFSLFSDVFECKFFIRFRLLWITVVVAVIACVKEIILYRALVLCNCLKMVWSYIPRLLLICGLGREWLLYDLEIVICW